MGANFAVEQRMRMIDFLLAHYGAVGRDQLVDYFGISTAQDTRDFRLYREKAPGNAVMDTVSKKYIQGTGFKRIYE
ncbi:hypothetical protein I6M29_22350 [Shewanella algae]|uniref:hypothetical protein n=1 Tax=Shewanella algae TaxID=38313 RepID=UPI001AAE96C5|nr:hypothetical protein [Shewanella algae]MBO2580276.1 hypothetical protein [Shewanella algae]